jgi:hypothetical protein
LPSAPVRPGVRWPAPITMASKLLLSLLFIGLLLRNFLWGLC